MGIRFCCHHCGAPLHVKDFQAGRRGRCPGCDGAFRVPLADADKSLPCDIAPVENATTLPPPLPVKPILPIETVGELTTSRISESTAEKNRRRRKLRRQKNYALGILLLFFLFLGLVVTLVIVLMRQSGQ